MLEDLSDSIVIEKKSSEEKESDKGRNLDDELEDDGLP